MEKIIKLFAAMPERSGVSQSGTAWKTRQFVGQEIEGQYPKKIVFEVFGEDKINEFNLHQNDVVKLHFDIDAREWNGKWFNSIRAWKVEHCDEQGNVIGQQATQQAQQPQPQQGRDDSFNQPTTDSDPLPF